MAESSRNGAEKTSFLTQCIEEVIEEMEELLPQLLGDEYGLGIFEEQVSQKELRAEFEAIAGAMDLSEFEREHQRFLDQYGQEQWDKQMRLRMARVERGRG